MNALPDTLDDYIDIPDDDTPEAPTPPPVRVPLPPAIPFPRPSPTPPKAGDAKDTSAQELLARLEACKRDPAKPPERQAPVLTLKGIPVATASNLTAILAQAKSGKTTFAAAVLGAAIASAQGDEGGDFLGAKAGPHPAGSVVLIFDSEQDPADHHDVLARAARRAGLESPPAWVHAFSCVGTGAANLRAMLRLKLEQLKGDGVPIWFAVLDGVADFCANPNDLEMSQALVGELLAHAGNHRCPIICVIHRNEGAQADPSARGHLGKELARKAAFNLVLEKSADEVTTVFATQNRGRPILKKDGPRFQWSNAEEMHVSLNKTSGAADADELRELAEEVFDGKEMLRYGELQEAVMKASNNKDTWAETKIKAMVRADVIRKAGPRKYMLK